MDLLHLYFLLHFFIKLFPYIAPIFLPIAIMFGHLFRLYEERNIRFEKGGARRLLYNLPIIFQSLMFITALISPSFIKYLKPGKDWGNIHLENGWQLIVLPILFQVMIMFLPALVKQGWRRGWFLTSYTLSVLFLVSIHFPMAHFLTSHKSAYPVSKAIHTLLPQIRSCSNIGYVFMELISIIRSGRQWSVAVENWNSVLINSHLMSDPDIIYPVKSYSSTVKKRVTFTV